MLLAALLDLDDGGMRLHAEAPPLITKRLSFPVQKLREGTAEGANREIAGRLEGLAAAMEAWEEAWEKAWEKAWE